MQKCDFNKVAKQPLEGCFCYADKQIFLQAELESEEFG